MFNSVLVVCVGNICRSPMGERMLRVALPGKRIDSAGIGALAGRAADNTALQVGAELGVSLAGHVARQLTSEIGAQYDLILVMETGHRTEVNRRWPQLSGKTMLFDQWIGGKGIADPYRKPIEFHREIRDRIRDAALAWAARLKQ